MVSKPREIEGKEKDAGSLSDFIVLKNAGELYPRDPACREGSCLKVEVYNRNINKPEL